MELKAIALGKLGLSLEDFYELTPVELKRINEVATAQRIEFFQLLQLANYAGFGQANSGKKFKPVFENKKEVKVRRVSLDEKLNDLEYIQSRLGGS